MESRTTLSTVTFHRPFCIPGLDGPQPAGTYTVQRQEEALDGVTFLGWRQTAVAIEIFRDGAVELVPIDGQELRAALVADGDQSTDPPAAPGMARARPRKVRRW
jgi:hypothetical protein